MKSHRVLVTALLSVTAALAGCGKSKTEGAAAAKQVEGSAATAAPVVPPPVAADPATPAATPTPAVAAGAAVVAPAAVASANLLETAKQAGTFSTFLKAVDAAGLTETLNGAGPFTVFAPTDEAFAKVPAADLDALLADKTKLAAVLQYHVVSGALASKELGAATTEASVGGAALAIDATSGLKVGGATVVKADLVASNGVIHAIDTVLTPPTK